MPTPTIAERMADYAARLSFRHLPPPVVHEAKRRILDSLGCALGAWDAAPCRITREHAQAVRQQQGATLWGTRSRTTPDLAAFANGALVRYLDFNDTYLSKEPAHPSDNIAAIIAVGEVTGASGRDVITAIVLAYELHARLCDAAALRPRGWDHVTYGPITSAVATAKLLRLSRRQTIEAINLAGVANVALRQTRVGDMSMWKAAAFSNATRNGVFAAQLAHAGMTGPSPIFEGEKGFMRLVSGPFDLAGLADGPRAGFTILETYIKHFPVEYHAQSAVEAALAIRRDVVAQEGKAALSRITDIVIGSYDVAIEIIGRDPEKWHPRTRETADHSFPYCVAAALLDGQVTLRSFGTRRLTDARLQALMDNVQVVADPDLGGRYPESMPTRLTIRTASGREYRAEVEYPLGHPKRPMSDDEVIDKFYRLAGRRLPSARAEALVERVLSLERVPDIGSLPRLLEVRNG